MRPELTKMTGIIIIIPSLISIKHSKSDNWILLIISCHRCYLHDFKSILRTNLKDY